MKDNNKTNYTNVTLNSTSSSIKAEPYPFSASAVIQSLFKFNKLCNGETCKGLLRRFVHKIANNNEISPHNDMNNKIPNLVQDDNAVVEQNDVINKNVKNLFPYFPISLSLKKKLRRFRILSWIIGGSAGSTQPSPGRATLSFRSCQNPQSGMTFIKQPAFTLAETLITLGIIGIVAAMTIPTLMQKYYEKQVIAKAKETQSIISQALKIAEEEYDTPENWGLDLTTSTWKRENAQKIADALRKGMKFSLDCGTSDREGKCCYNKPVHYLNGTLSHNYAIETGFYKVVLMNGVSLWFGIRGDLNQIDFFFDVNGNNSPNTIGKDIFALSYRMGQGLMIDGAPGDDTPYQTHCKLEGLGWGCLYYITQFGNMNYLHPQK